MVKILTEIVIGISFLVNIEDIDILLHPLMLIIGRPIVLSSTKVCTKGEVVTRLRSCGSAKMSAGAHKTCVGRYSRTKVELSKQCTYQIPASTVERNHH